MNHRSLAFRLGVWYALLVSATFVVVGAGLYLGLGQYLRANVRDSLKRWSTQMEQFLVEAPATISATELAAGIELRVAPEFNNRFVRIIRTPDEVVYRSGPPVNRGFDPAAIQKRSDEWPASRDIREAITPDHRHLLIRATRLVAPSGQYLIEFGISLDPVIAAQERVLEMLAFLLPALAVLASGSGYLLVNRALSPVDQLSHTAEQISLLDLSTSLPVVATGDALQRLSVSLNRMLERLRNSVQSSRRFLADASHEIRTPLTVIKGELQEIGRSPEMTPAEMRDTVCSVLEEVARLEQLVNGLLTLARIDAGDVRVAWSEVDLTELARTTAEHMRLLADERGIKVDFELTPHLTVRGDQAQIKQIIVNLLHNAIRFTPPSGTVKLRTVTSGGCPVLEIEDSGIGIPETALPYVFDRFYRVDEARSRDEGGSGLGLSIVKSICVAHGAVIEVSSKVSRGSIFRIRFRSGEGGGETGKQPVAGTGPS